MKVAAIAALATIAVLALQFGIRAARISGMGVSGAFDPIMLGFVWDSPLGTAAVFRVSGALMVIAALFGGMLGRGAGLVGAVLIAVSYSFVGHSLGDPRWLLASLLTLHLLTAAFWVGALIPLRHAADKPDGTAVLHRFGQCASFSVAMLVVVGVILAALMSGSLTALMTTAYGWTLLAKLGVVSGLMGLAALNKWRLVPALASGTPSAAQHLHRSIQVEIFAVVLILLATATLTSVTTPPVNI
ncbi:CopD family protein [uncultured Tateyamaria sp.]|uniref:copper resistance D family protein n=1 Tax=uncultured Tateyamaria sp. TaxID=455651 RepID=UPI0026104303|nr:CopD family protein [uncultured Tateyamaria sp.]